MKQNNSKDNNVETLDLAKEVVKGWDDNKKERGDCIAFIGQTDPSDENGKATLFCAVCGKLVPMVAMLTSVMAADEGFRKAVELAVMVYNKHTDQAKDYFENLKSNSVDRWED